MSNNDSFIDEVSEEIRRDRLFALLRRYGWIAGLVVVAIVGAAAFVEVRSAQSQARAQALGDSLFDVLETPDATPDQIAAIEADERGRPITALVEAALALEAEDALAMRVALDSLAIDEDAPDIYRTLAELKNAMLAEPGPDRRAALSALAQPGQPFRLLAAEQLAYQDVTDGETEAAIIGFGAILQDAEATQSLQSRARAMIVALGGNPEDFPGAGQ